MSREFGSYAVGYFHQQIDNAADDLAGARYPSTRAWAEFFRAFYPVAYAIASAEAADAREGESIIAALRQTPALERALEKVNEFLAPYREVAESAVNRVAAERAPPGGYQPPEDRNK